MSWMWWWEGGDIWWRIMKESRFEDKIIRNNDRKEIDFGNWIII